MPPKKGSKKQDKKNKEDVESSKKEETESKKDSKKESKKEAAAPQAPKFENQFDKMLESLKNDLLHELLEANKTKLAKNSAKKKLVEAFIKVSTDAGKKIFFEKIADNKDLMKVAMTVFGEVDHDNKSKLATDLKKKYDELGQAEFFKKQTSETLNKFCELLAFQEESNSKDELVTALGEELLSAGAVKVFEEMKKEFLVDVAKDLGIESKGGKTALVKRIVGQVFTHLLEESQEEEKKDKESKKEKAQVDKKPIAKGVTGEDLYQYYSEELVEFCAKNNLKKTGSKKEVIKRILQFLNMTPEDLAKQGEKKKKKRRRPAGSGPAKKKKKPAKKEGEEGEKKEGEKKTSRKRKSEGGNEESAAKKQKQ